MWYRMTVARLSLYCTDIVGSECHEDVVYTDFDVSNQLQQWFLTFLRIVHLRTWCL